MRNFIKKFVCATVSTAVALSISGSAFAQMVNMDLYYDGANHKYSAEEVKIVVKGEKITGLDVPPLIIGERTMVPARAVFEKLGCEIVDVSLPSLEYAVSAYYLISSAEAASNLSRFDGIKYGLRSGLGEDFNDLIKNSRREGFGQEVKRRIMLGNYALCSGYYDAYYKNATRIRTQIRNEYADIFSKCDVMLTPTAPTTAYKIGEQENDPVKMYLADIYTVTVNIAGLPAISTTCGYDSKGLPIGMSLIGKAFDEKTIIAVCDRFEKDFERKEIVL